MMREIVLDTETTGFDPEAGHRMVEIGCIELMNLVPTGRTFHRYINPERDMPEDAFRVHGLSGEFLAKHGLFASVAEELIVFLGDAPIVAHNAGFDMRFVNAELVRCGHAALDLARAIDTVQIARKKFPGAPASLDALCRRFEVDNSRRTRHGALLDAELLAEVYLALRGGRQVGLTLEPEAEALGLVPAGDRPVRPPRPHAPSEAELAAHAEFLASKIKGAIWLA
jgi:DNA polymerase-3 subunit epsilon